MLGFFFFFFFPAAMQIHPRLSWLLLGCFVSSSSFLLPIVFSLFRFTLEKKFSFFCCLVHVENLTKIAAFSSYEIKSLRSTTYSSTFTSDAPSPDGHPGLVKLRCPFPSKNKKKKQPKKKTKKKQLFANTEVDGFIIHHKSFSSCASTFRRRNRLWVKLDV